ncbi:MAG: carboxypeptidase regulatory-like domain-containing protein, partial [Patescibacteria group bacterium]
GSVTIGSIACGTLGGGVVVNVAGAPIQIGDRVIFSVEGVVNGSARGISSAGYSGIITTYNEKHAFLESVISLPFFLTPAGVQKISGVVFNDNGAGLFGFARDGVQGGSEPGLAGVEVCLSGKSGSRCITTDTNGFYQFTKINDGIYGVSAITPSTSMVVGGPFFVDVALTGQDRMRLNFAFRPAERMITAQIDNIPEGTDVRVFASGSVNGGQSITRTVVWNGQTTRSITLPVSDGVWSVGVESMSVYTATFIAPAARQIFVDGDAEYRVLLPLKSAQVSLSGRVVDTVGAGVQGAYVVATPRVFTIDVAKEAVTRTNADGSFALNVAPGRYRVEVSMPGMPAVPGVDIDGAVENLRFVIPKGERAVSGRVLDESGGPLAFAVVSAQEIDSVGRPIGARVERSTDATGLFVLFVSAGRWRLRAQAPVSGEIPDAIVTILNKDVFNQNMQISVENLGTVNGRITKAGEPVMGAFVTVSNPINGRPATTENDGRYAIRVKAGVATQ